MTKPHADFVHLHVHTQYSLLDGMILVSKLVKQAAAFRMPDFTSAMTAADGRFVIYLPAGGRYWLGARAHILEKPAPGEPFGLFEGSPDHSLEVPEGSFVDGIDIVLRGFGEPR